jgi:hypothetical protein
VNEIEAECGVKVLSDLIRVLFYADDLVLLAESPEHLQRLMDTLCIFCNLNLMTVNIKKSEVVVFNKQYCQHDGLISVKFQGRYGSEAPFHLPGNSV